MAGHKLNLKMGKIIKLLKQREKEQDKILSSSRALIRSCANAIKLVHARDVKRAKQELAKMQKELSKLPRSEQARHYLSPIWQEVAEARLLIAAVEHKPLPDFQKLGIPHEAYLLGLCDAIGELRREMLEALKRGDRKEAGYFFSLMSSIYEELLPVRFSNSVLPNFRRKQDVARMQVEQARSEFLRNF